MRIVSPRRAFWEALATVCFPSLLIWGALIYSIRKQASSDEWILYLVFFALPLPLFFPIYKRYREGVPSNGKQKTPKYHFITSFLSAAVFVSYLMLLLRKRETWDLVLYGVIAIIWLGMGIDHFRRALKARANPPQNTPVKFDIHIQS